MWVVWDSTAMQGGPCRSMTGPGLSLTRIICFVIAASLHFLPLGVQSGFLLFTLSRYEIEA